jgi:hypothetical protein
MAKDIDNYMKAVEVMRRMDSTFLEGAQVDGRMRGILLDWVTQLQTKFGLTAETFYLSCFILDRVVKELEANKDNYQQIGLACIFVASKFEEVMIPAVADFIYMGGDICSIENLFKAERSVSSIICGP